MGRARRRMSWAALAGLALGVLVLGAWPRAMASSSPEPLVAGDLLAGRTIVIDPGHGGWDPGALGRVAREDRINLAISLALRRWLELAGAHVLMTWSRVSDIAPNRKYRIQARSAWINATGGNLLVDIHCNAGVDARGPQVFYWDGASSRLLADYLSEELHYFTHTHRAVVRIDQYVLRHSVMPAVNVEVGFINNPQEERLLIRPVYQRELAWYIFIGIERWFLRGHWPVSWLKTPPPTEILSR